jgi:hypothetical protein
MKPASAHPDMPATLVSRPLPWGSYGLAASAALAAGSGLFVAGLYRDNPFVQAAWRGNDVVTLALAVPLLLWSLGRARQGSVPGLLVWLGMIDYLMYAYAYYLFGAAFNSLFLFYVVLFTGSALVLVFSLASIDAAAISRRAEARTPVRWVSAYMAFVAVGLTTVYVAQSIRFVITDELPAVVVATGHPTSLVFALDLSMLVPGLALGARWLWRRQPWGYVLAGILTTKGAVYTLALAAGSALAVEGGFSELSGQIPLWLALSVGGAAAAVSLLLGLRGQRPQL